jgi:hypothetical protein
MHSSEDGGQFEGFYINDQAHGQGRFTYPFGDTYDGAFQNNKASGRGTLTRTDGSGYEGDWHEDLYHG